MAATSKADVGPIIGHIVHWLSDKLVHPHSGSDNPENGEEAVLWTGGLGEKRLQFRFVPEPGHGHFGNIQHVPSGKYLHPKSGLTDPENGTTIVFWSGTHVGTLFAFDEVNQVIRHRRGKYMHAKSGNSMPSNGTRVVMWDGFHDGARFFFVNNLGEKISPYPTPELRGEWKIIFAVDDPKAIHTYEIKHKVGRSVTTTTTEQHSWNISAEIGIKWFSASAEYGGFVQRANSQTWNEETEVTHKIEIKPGKSVVVWQYVFSASQFDDECVFSSNILGDTTSVDNKPVLD